MSEADDHDEWQKFKRGVKRLPCTVAASARPTKRLVDAKLPINAKAIPVAPTPAKRWRRLEKVDDSIMAATATHKSAATLPAIIWQREDNNFHMADKQLQERLERGAVRPQARLDLHNHTEAAAFAALQDFIALAQQRQYRLLLIITGRGDILRNAVPRWLKVGALAATIRWIYPAATKHGGAGAYYIGLVK